MPVILWEKSPGKATRSRTKHLTKNRWKIMFKEEITSSNIMEYWPNNRLVSRRATQKKNDSRSNVCKDFILRQWDVCKSIVKIIKGKPVLDSLSMSEPKKNNNNLHYRSPFRQDIQVNWKLKRDCSDNNTTATKHLWKQVNCPDEGFILWVDNFSTEEKCNHIAVSWLKATTWIKPIIFLSLSVQTGEIHLFHICNLRFHCYELVLVKL